MKRIEAVIRPERLGQVAALLAEAGITGFTISDVRGHGQAPQATGEYRGHTYEMLVAHKLLITVFVDDGEVEAAVSAISGGGATEAQNGDGFVAVSELAGMYRIGGAPAPA